MKDYMGIPSGTPVEVIQDKKDTTKWFISDGQLAGTSIPKTAVLMDGEVGSPEVEAIQVCKIENNRNGMLIRIDGVVVYNAPPNMDSRDQKILDAINLAYSMGLKFAVAHFQAAPAVSSKILVSGMSYGPKSKT